MTVERSDFPKFFAAVNGGRHPFRWQERLLDTLLADGRWPDRVAAPTGAGKTSAIDVHVFATALTTANGGPRLPRRLAMVVGRRVLVDDQYDRATALAETLGNRKDQHPLVAEVAEILAGLHTAEGDAARDAPALVTARLRGGYVPSRSWVDYPTACAVLCATPDMWGSRLLFGGYGTSRWAASREAGLLAFDSAVMVDEAHLARQLLVTARRVADLAHVAEQPLTDVPALQVIEVSATPADGNSAAGQLRTVSVGEDDLAEELLAKRLTRPKPVTLLPVPGWPSGRQPGKAAAALAQAVAAMHGEAVPAEDAARTVGCFVNTVPMAMAVADALRTQGLRVVTVCGQVRPADIARLASEYPGFLTTRGHDGVDVLVTTQSLEVGADLDLAGIVTELATGSALAQRAGRVNRLGKRAEGPVTVVVPDGDITDKMSSGPYSSAELKDALEWVASRSADSAGFAPWAIRQSPPPGAHPRRTLYQRPELGDAWHWARTSDDLAAPPELELWLADTLEEETSVAIVVRDALPADPPEALEFVRDLPPAPWEAFPVPYRTAQQVLAELLDLGRAPVRVRGDEVTSLRFRPASRAGTGAGTRPRVDIRPGDVIVADSSAEICTRAAGQGFSPQVVAAQASADDTDGLDAARRGKADDVLHLHPDPRPGSVVLRIEWSPERKQVAGFPQDTAHRILADFTETFEDYAERARRDSLAALISRVPADELPPGLLPVAAQAVRLLKGKVKDSDIVLREAGDGGTRVVVIDNRRAVADEDVRQVFTPRDRDDCPVLLHAHQRDVGARGTRIAAKLALPDPISSALVTAGEHHDDGKADLRFQVHRLGATDAGQPWAKSLPGKTVRQVRKQEGEGGLPAGWRHEQRSVVDGWPAARAVRDADPELILRLIGTSHGRGRPGFPHVCAELAGRGDTDSWRDLAIDLFDAGAWDELIEATHLRYGVWGCAFLEAVFRAADCQISREGR
ncbi:MAG TPA: type I-U CRISPR-associated helicase/endonuclease Cas3 [Trebonia sp.]|jgi:CRISPR-associated endonuclease/helicase Cas3|nr:type I-U CRISPR-associated helicase/endonuclease Cas3 [Trebonia sp.]